MLRKASPVVGIYCENFIYRKTALTSKGVSNLCVNALATGYFPLMDKLPCCFWCW